MRLIMGRPSCFEQMYLAPVCVVQNALRYFFILSTYELRMFMAVIGHSLSSAKQYPLQDVSFQLHFPCESIKLRAGQIRFTQNVMFPSMPHRYIFFVARDSAFTDGNVLSMICYHSLGQFSSDVTEMSLMGNWPRYGDMRNADLGIY